jgi:hypothetical protein
MRPAVRVPDGIRECCRGAGAASFEHSLVCQAVWMACMISAVQLQPQVRIC